MSPEQAERLAALAQHLRADIGLPLLTLIEADAKAHLVVELEGRTRRAEDLAKECQRQLAIRDRQCDELRDEKRRLENDLEQARAASALAAGSRWSDG